MRYESPEAYIYGEYDGAVADAAEILDRVLADLPAAARDAAALQIAGYFTGCLRADGSPRAEIAAAVGPVPDRSDIIAARMEQLKGNRPW